MKARFALDKPDAMEATIHITMTLKQWRELQEQLVNVYPSWELSSVITDVLMQAGLVFYADTDAKG